MAYSSQTFIFIVLVIAVTLAFRNSSLFFNQKIYAKSPAQLKRRSHYVYLPAGVYFTLLTFQVLSGGLSMAAPFV